MIKLANLRQTKLTRLYTTSPDPLYEAIYRKSIALGAPIDELGRICEWIVDSPPDDDESDHWQNIRPY